PPPWQLARLARYAPELYSSAGACETDLAEPVRSRRCPGFRSVCDGTKSAATTQPRGGSCWRGTHTLRDHVRRSCHRDGNTFRAGALLSGLPTIAVSPDQVGIGRHQNGDSSADRRRAREEPRLLILLERVT